MRIECDLVGSPGVWESAATSVRKLPGVPISSSKIYIEAWNRAMISPFLLRQQTFQLVERLEMQFNDAASWQGPPLGRAQQLPPNIRPASAASIASSASSFRIPGIVPAHRRNPQQQEEEQQVQPTASHASFVRLFTPQPQDATLLHRPHARDTDKSIDWLAKGGPNPRDLIDSSQSGLEFNFGPRPESRLQGTSRDHIMTSLLRW